MDVTFKYHVVSDLSHNIVVHYISPCGLLGAWAAVPALTAMHRSSSGLFSAAVLTVPSLDPLSAMIREGHSWHELGSPHDRDVYEAIKGWEPINFSSEHRSGEVPTRSQARGPSALSMNSTEPEIMPQKASRNRSVASGRPALSLLVRSGVFDDKVGYWEHAAFVAGLRQSGTLGESMAVKEVLLRVKAGGHDCFDDPGDDAEMCAWIHSFAPNGG